MAVTSSTVGVAGQTTGSEEHPTIGSTLEGDILRDLPTTDNPFVLLETIPEAISDRFSSGGLNAATAPRFGAFLNSWTQTQIRIGDITITDPRAGGIPLILPTLTPWDRVTTSTGAMGVDENASGISMTLNPRRPGANWSRTIDASISGDALGSNSPGSAPFVDRVRGWGDGSAFISGPLSPRLGLVATGWWRSLSHVAGPETIASSAQVASGLTHFVYSASPRDEFRVLAWGQHATTDASTDNSVHLQSTWERRDPARIAWRIFGGYTTRNRSLPVKPTRIIDSLDSDPISDLIDPDDGVARRWTFGARLAPAATRRFPTLGVDLDRAGITPHETTLTQVGELVDGSPSRLWTIHGGAGGGGRHRTTLAAHANEHLTFGRLTLDVGARFETMTAAADQAARGISWTSFLPRAMARWRITDTAGLEFVAGYRRSAYELPLNVLAIGDPAAPFADVALWNGASAGPMIARVGPGTGGDPAFMQIDAELKQPTTDELVLALESRPLPGLFVQLARVTKRETPLLDVVDTGVDSSSYSSFQVPDPSFEPGSDDGGPFVTVYNRPPGTYGRDQYVLTNRLSDREANFWGIKLTVSVTKDRFTLLAAGALTWAKGPAAAVGFLPTENDQDIVGNLFVDRNADTSERGQLFQDRSHTVKLAGVYRLPWRMRLGAIARYQDGQPFARVVIAPNLTQGRTAVRAYPNGGTAFTYTGTFDVRLQKLFSVGATEVAAILDVYNLPNMKKEVAEYVVSGPLFRTPSALQPPRMAVIGVRISF